MRDSALGAIALTSSRNLIRWRPYLFQRVTLHFSNVLSFALFLSNQAGLVRSVRSLRFLEVRREDPEKLVQITAYSALPGRRSSDPADDDFGLRHVGSGMMTITSFLLNCLSSLEELIVDHDIFLFNFQTRDPNVEKTIPLPFLAKSLKKLYVKLTGPDYIALSARNFIWLMLFCSALNELAIGFTLSETDISFLTEFKESFKNKSKIKKLAIQFRFVAFLSGKKNSKWKLYGKQCKSGLSKIQKEQALLDLLLVTSGLQAFEINGTASLESFSEEERPDFRTVLSSGLSSSSETLHHHRNFLSLQEAGSGRPASSFNSSPFQNVKILSTERHGLVFMKREGLRSNIEVIQLTWYVTSAGLPTNLGDSQHYPEDADIAALIESDLVPNLKRVVVPKQPINCLNKVEKSSRKKEVWAKRRQELRSKDYFRNGQIELREAEAGDYGEFEFRTMSLPPVFIHVADSQICSVSQQLGIPRKAVNFSLL